VGFHIAATQIKSHPVKSPNDTIPGSHQNSVEFHFITFSCYQRQPYLGNPEARTLFERSLETMRRRYSFYVFGYVIMPEHVHLLLSEPEKGVLSKAIQALKLSVALQSKERPFWQARYYDFNVFTQRKHVEKLKYMHRNPVTRAPSDTDEN
jgi:putative transposase